MNESVHLSQLTYVTSDGRELTLKELLDHWDWHVAHLAKDLAEKVDDDHAWAAEDFLATLYIRSRLAAGTSSAAPMARELLAGSASPSDGLFREMTESDRDNVVLRFADEAAEPGEW